ncbi:MAG: carbohydrate ABC transporter permease [Velocimicrobium sp.]
MKTWKKNWKNDVIGYLFVLPALLYMLFFVGYPIVSNIILSLQDVSVQTLRMEVKPFVGLKNYIEILKDPVMITSLKNTLIFTVCSLIFQFIFGFALALFFNKNFKFARPIRGLLMMPWMIPITITALMFQFVFGTDIGILNHALQGLGIIKDRIDWLTSTNTAMFAIIFTNIWIGIPFNMILISTGLTTISKELFESAAIDGANKIQTFVKITVPLLRTTIESVLILGFIYTFKVFDLVYVMTGGGPVNTTHMLSTYSYKLSFELFKYSKGATVANVLFVILLAVSVIYLKFIYTDEGDA